MKKKHLFLLAAVALLAACSSEKDMPAPQTEAPEANPYKVELSDALKTADKFLAKLDPAATRTPRKVASVKTLKGASTRSGENSSDLFYLVNYADNKGFAVLSADSRLAPIYAVSEEGNITEEDMQKESGLKLFFNMLSSVSPEEPDSLPDPEPIEIPNIVDINYYGPYLPEEVRYWHQSSPFNSQCPWIKVKYMNQLDSIQAPVGCMALVCAQVMSAFEWPSQYRGETLDWNHIKTNRNYYQIPVLLKTLGNPENLNMTYTKYESHANASNLAKTFRNFGYNATGTLEEKSIGYLMDDFRNSNKPAIVNAFTQGTNISGEQVTGNHVFVCDGYMSYYETHYQDVAPEYWGEVTGYVMFHFVWGYGGNSNGYFFWPDGGATLSLKDAQLQDDRELSMGLYKYVMSDFLWWNNYTPNR